MLYSIARRPIGPGCRLRRFKQITGRIERALASDEENTSEYSHPPSSQSSTLESNPDVQRALRHIRHSQKVSKNVNLCILIRINILSILILT